MAAKKTAPTPKLFVGCIVHYVIGDGLAKGKHRPAIVTEIAEPKQEVCGLHLFLTPKDVEGRFLSPVSFLADRKHSEGKELGTWHFIEQE